MSPPTFNIVVEIQDRDKVAIHPDVAEAVDSILRGHPLETEIRWLDENGEVKIAKEMPAGTEKKPSTKGKRAKDEKQPRIYLFGVNRARLEQMAKEMHLTLDIVNNSNTANIFITSKAYYRNRPQKIIDAEAANIPIYVLKSNTPNQIRQLLNTIYPSDNRHDPIETAVEEAQSAVNQVRNGDEIVELRPQSAYIRRLQHLVAEQNDLPSDSTGKEPNRRVRIFKHGARNQ